MAPTPSPGGSALILGGDSAVGAYLARLLDARGLDVAATGDRTLIAGLGIADSIGEVGDGAAPAAAAGSTTVYAIDDGSAARDALIDEVVATLARAPGRPRLVHVVDLATLPDRPAARRRIAALAVRRSEERLPFASALLGRHDSRLGRGDTLAARIIGALVAGTRVALTDPGPQDWGWTPEYVDAIQRLGGRPDLPDLRIGTGRTITAGAVRDAAAQRLRADPALVRLEPVPVPAEAPIDADRLKQLTGWRAGTWGRDLVQALCEGVAAR